MDFDYYLDKFREASAQIDKNLLSKQQMEFKVGTWLNSVALKMLKKGWANKSKELFQSDASIFFSVWINETTIRENKILYNIHALKLRKLNGYSITSREFAGGFRSAFRNFEHQWPNVSTTFGPLTLMQGWKKLDSGYLQDEIAELANQFLQIDHIIDNLLATYKRSG